MCSRRKKKCKSKVLSGGFCLRDSEAEQKAFQFLHIYCRHINKYSPTAESNKQNPPDTALDLPFFFRYKYIVFPRNIPSSAPSEKLPYWFRGNFCGYVSFELVVE